MPNLATADASLERFTATPSGREKPSRFWKADIDALDLNALANATGKVEVAFDGVAPRVIATDLATARRDHATLVSRVFGAAVQPYHKYAHLGAAFANDGAFIYVPENVHADELNLALDTSGDAAFAYVLVLLERGSSATIVEQLRGDAALAHVTVEIVASENSAVEYAAFQNASVGTKVYATRVALPSKDARVALRTAELGASLSVGDIAVTLRAHGADADVATLFFPTGTQHVDIVSSADHIVGDTSSATLVKSAASQSGQARYLGNIRIVAQAQNSNASLRDDALLLSKRAHIDSIPALEIAANEVKAFHGATVGAIDDEALFYMTSRGIERTQAERMIALGFFEPVVDRFPGEALRETLRTALQAKIEGDV